MEKLPNANNDDGYNKKEPLLTAKFLEEELDKERQKTQDDFDRDEQKEFGKKAIDATTSYTEHSFSDDKLKAKTTVKAAPGYEDVFGNLLNNKKG